MCVYACVCVYECGLCAFVSVRVCAGTYIRAISGLMIMVSLHYHFIHHFEFYSRLVITQREPGQFPILKACFCG